MASQLRVDKILPVDGAPTSGGGGIVQLKQTVKTDVFSTSTTGDTLDVTGVTVTITPKFSTSKIFVMISGYYSNDNNDSFAHLFLARSIGGGTVDNTIAIGDARSGTTRATMGAALRSGGGQSNNISRHFGCQFLDSPNTTSSVEYKLRMLVTQGTPAVIGGAADGGNDANRGSYPTFITAMEVSA